MANFLGKKIRVEFNGHDVSHLTGASIGTVGKIWDTYQTLNDPFDHDIEITDEASGSFDFVADDAISGEQKFKEIMAMTKGYSDLADGDGTTLANLDNDDMILSVDEDWTAPDNQGDYTGTRLSSWYKRLTEGDAYLDFDGDNDTAFIPFIAQGENIDTMGFVLSSTAGSSNNAVTFKMDIYDDLSLGNISKGETAAAASGGSTTTLVDSGVLTHADNSWIGATIRFLDGANAGIERVITDSAAGATSVTFAAVPIAVASGDAYQISGAPSETGTGSFAVITFTIEYDDFNGANKWRLLSSGDLGATYTGGDELTIGKRYWIRLYRHASAGNTGRLRLDSTSVSSQGSFHSSNGSTTALADTYQADKEAINYIKFKSTEGLNVVVYDYKDQAESGGVKWTFNKVKLDSVTPSFANRQATRASVSWKCNNWSYDAI